MNYMIIISSEIIVYYEIDSILKLESEVVQKEVNTIY